MNNLPGNITETKTRYATLSRLHQAKGGLNYCLDVFGDHLAEREGYKASGGMDAVYYYLMTKHHWLPRDVKSMSQDDLTFALREELQDWPLPPEARV